MLVDDWMAIRLDRSSRRIRGEAGPADRIQHVLHGEKIQTGYELTAERLSTFSRVEFIEPDGAFYCFFRVDGLTDSFAAAGEILEQTKVGLAPGVAFGPQGENNLRLCYAQPADVLEEAFVRLEPFLSK